MEVKKFGNLSDAKTQSRTVYDSDGISPTLCSGMDHGNTMPHICEETQTVNALNPMPDGTCRTLKNQYAKNGVANFDNQGTWGASGAIETVRIKQATKDGYIECKVGGVADLSYPTSNTRRGRVQEGGDVCPTLTATETGVCRIEKNICAIDEQNLNFRNETFGTLTTDGSSPKHNNRVMEYTKTQYRIRKLTPKECWRLMSFTDEDFYKAEKVNSNTQLYKQAGNSIVASVLEAIFRQMHIQDIPTWNEEKGA